MSAPSQSTSASSGPRPPPPKSILKRPSARSNNAKTKDMVAKLAVEQEPHEQTLLEKAVKQAEILQRLKESGDIREPVPLEVFERLSQLPLIRTSDLSAANPSPEDAQEFISAIETFVPSEYDDLIEERNILGNCGYALCPRPRRNYVGEWKICPTGIARAADLNKWCSEKCARRALHIRVQLDNPTYIRRRNLHGDGKVKTVTKIELREEDKPKQQQHGQITQTAPGASPVSTAAQNNASPSAQAPYNSISQLPQRLQNLDTKEGEEQPADDAKSRLASSRNTALAAERIGGRPGSGPDRHSAAAEATANLTLSLPINSRQQKPIEVTIREKETILPAQPPDKRKANSGDKIEGHKVGSKFSLDRKKDKEDQGGKANGTVQEGARDVEDSDDYDDDDDDDDLFPTVRF